MLTDNNLLAFLSKLGSSFSTAQPGIDTSSMGGQISSQIPLPDNQPETIDPTFEQRINEMFNLKHDAADRLGSYSQNQPTREQYKPGKLRQAGGFLANLGSGGPVGIANGQVVGYRSDIPRGLAAQDHILNDPYNKAVADYQMRLKPLSEAAESEARLNTANRQVGSSLLMNERQINAENNRVKDREAKNTIAEEKVEISRQRALAYDFKTHNSGYKSFIDDNGMVVFVGPQGDIRQTGLHQNKLTEADKLALQIEGRLKVEEARSDNAKELEDQRQGNRTDLEDTKAGNRKDLKTTPKPTDTKPTTPAAEKTALINKANQIVSQHPEWKKYYDISSKGVTVKPSSLFRDLNDTKARDAAYQALYGNSPGTPIINHDVEKPKSKYQVTIR